MYGQPLAICDKLGQVSDPQAVGQVVVQGKVLLGYSDLLNGAKPIR
jgi:hypothetical protein